MTIPLRSVTLGCRDSQEQVQQVQRRCGCSASVTLFQLHMLCLLVCHLLHLGRDLGEVRRRVLQQPTLISSSSIVEMAYRGEHDYAPEKTQDKEHDEARKIDARRVAVDKSSEPACPEMNVWAFIMAMAMQKTQSGTAQRHGQELCQARSSASGRGRAS